MAGDSRLVAHLLTLLASPALIMACSPPVQHFTGLPPAPFSAGLKNVLLIGDSISMGGDPHSDPVTLSGSPGGYGSYVLRLLTGHNIVSVQHNGGPYNASKAAAGNEQAGNTAHGLDCLDYWIGRNASHPRGLPWDVIHFNFGLHDLETAGPTGPYAVPPANYSRNLAEIWERLAATGAKVIWASTT
jgi:acyl-CoA thioesterase-1